MAHEKEEPKEVLQYPLDSKSYEILDEVGSGASSVVYKAICMPMYPMVVAIKAVDPGQSFWLHWLLSKPISLLSHSHPNILNPLCSFTVDDRLWVVMPFMSAGSLQSIMSSSFPDGFSEPCIAVILKEILSALSYLDKKADVHKYIKPRNILIDSNGSVKLADFEMPSISDISRTSYWVAPEARNLQINGYVLKADIWSFGITALELAHGRPPLSHHDHLPPSKHKNFSKAFKDMVASCLHQDPSKRPSAETLSNHSFFENCGGLDFLVENVLQGLPSVEERFKESKIIKHEGGDSSARQCIKETRMISGWSFNEERFEIDPVFQTESTDDDSRVKL
ncbi:serine/threonine-protein kinase BLUS1-like [Corylus avellana]|uniref:serine/threonine-protein kinase BLUS1-like n=1 Tax=Corylus avellana TaxID=13451 RepID=UPI001E1F4363|nr:serine/threonine-protein kinase BLUS1-like [Corylus avellana]